MTAIRQPEYAIIGGGISGLSLAIALHHRGIKISVYEQAHKFGEIGAGVSFTGNAVQAMKICHEGVAAAFEKVCTRNVWPSKRQVWFDYYNGYDPIPQHLFTISNDIGQAGVHRARFLAELEKLLPENLAHFGKRLDSLTQSNDGRWQITFVDGSTATADAVIGSDGIKSRVRQLMYGEQNPRSFPTYSHKYAYRALAPMDKAVEAIGEVKAKNSCMHIGQGSHVLTFPVNHAQTLNIVAFHTTKDDWPDHNKLTRSATREEALQDFADFGPDVTKLLKLTEPDLDVWAIFHLADNPLPAYAKGSVCLIGDAAHATSPHHGAGAGMCIEDAAVLAELLADDLVGDPKSIEAAFATFDEVRRERGNWLVQSAQHIGNCYEWLADGIGSDFSAIEKEINERNGKIANVDVRDMCEQARGVLTSKLKN